MRRCTILWLAILCLALSACNDSGLSTPSAGANQPGQGEDGDDGGTPTETPPPGDDCAYTQGYWRNHTEDWPVTSLTLGSESYATDELLALMGNGGDASLILAQQLIAAMLNVENGAMTTSEVAGAITDANDWMATWPDADGRLAYGVSPASPEGQSAVGLSQILDDFNNGLQGTPHCDDPDSGPSGGDDDDGGLDGA